MNPAAYPRPKITSYEALRARIDYLDTIKEAQEEALKADFKQVLESLQPVNLLKSAVENIKQDRDLKNQAGELGLSLGLDFLVDKLFKKNSSTGAYIKATLVEQVAAFVLDRYGDKIEALVRRLTDKLRSLLKTDSIEKDTDS
jgi:hypothetical protein